jgi:hypothetical protein
MRKRLHSQEALEFDDRGTVAQSQPNLSSRFEVKQEHRDTGEGKTREGIKDLLRSTKNAHRGKKFYLTGYIEKRQN